MDSRLGFLCVLLATVTPVLSELCVTCGTNTEFTCTEKQQKSNVECDFKTHKCAAVFHETDSRKFTYQTCIKKEECDKSATFSYLTAKYKVSTACCDKENCTINATVPSFGEPERNGKVCPYCATSEFTRCHSVLDMHCTGEEKECFNISAEYKDKTPELHNILGCASKGICELKDVIAEHPLRFTNVTFSTILCDGASSLQIYTVLFFVTLAATSMIGTCFSIY